jgi:hypothetical protein
MKISAMTDTSDLRGRLADFSRIVGVEKSHAVRQFARVACVNLATETQPFGKDSSAKEQGETAVARDIHKAYYPATGSKFLKQAVRIAENHQTKTGKKSSSDKFKNRMLRYQMEGNDGALAKIAADMGFTRAMVDSFDSSYHKSVRDGRGRVRGANPYLVIGSGERDMERYIEQTQRKVGLTKAGWAKCAEAIPLDRASSATRGIPQWVTRNLSRATGHISDQSQDPGNPKVIMTNSTPWTSIVLTPNQAQEALNLARNNFVKYMNTAIKKTLRQQAKLSGAA